MKSVADLELSNFRVFESEGSLVPIEGRRDIPISIVRTFFVYGVEAGKVRGNHAHRVCNQVVVCPQGAIDVVCDDGMQKRVFRLEYPYQYLFIPCGIWATENYLSEDSMLLVFTDLAYDKEEYIEDYEEFLAFRSVAKQTVVKPAAVLNDTR